MSEVRLQKHAEKMAEKAENLDCFSGLKLLHIRKHLEDMLLQIGKGEIFDQYTRHDIKHIDGMLDLCEWLIPEETKSAMTYSDWLMLVLSIYFHDLGMVVTKAEFDNRNTNVAYRDFIKNVQDGDFGIEFRNKVERLDDDKEKFLYQEFVRKHHAERIKSWVSGTVVLDESSSAVQKHIQSLLVALKSSFKKDLGMICESHQSDDLDDFSKFKTAAKYGQSPQAIANLHYVAIILRTTDLLHITSDRAPSTLYSLIDPTDPISIIEWNKQQAVSSVSPKDATDERGNIKKDLPKDTIEIWAEFSKAEKAEAYFGLMSYIRYAREQINRSNRSIQESIRTQDTRHYLFPWKDIDDSNVTADGFEPKQFHFVLDQENILKLLIGHTLYNDSSIVVRELVQNGIDAIKLQNWIENESHDTPTHGKISVKWESDTRDLTFTDNGTGMTLGDIENYLLRVGVSKYRSAEFQKKYPSFSSISRFGIGLLTCFMVANDIDIITKSKEDSQANHISIRGAHGKYLLKKLDETELDSSIRLHGTQITLHVRSDVLDIDILQNLNKWIVFPAYPVDFIEGSKDAVHIGFRSPKEMLEAYYSKSDLRDRYKIGTQERDGVAIAYLLEYNKFFDEWTFAQYQNEKEKREDDIYGLCIDGVRVEFDTPGFKGKGIVAIANVQGIRKVQTNVARSAIEINDEYRNLLLYIYRLYIQQVISEMERLQKCGASDAKIASETEYLLNSLIESRIKSGGPFEAIEHDLLEKALMEVKCIIIETAGERKLVSPSEMSAVPQFVILDSRMMTESEFLLRELKEDKFFEELLMYIRNSFDISAGTTLLSNFNKYNYIHQLALKNSDVCQIDVLKDKKMVKLKYCFGTEGWIKVSIPSGFLFLPQKDICIKGLSANEVGVRAQGNTYFVNNNAFTQYITKSLNEINRLPNREEKSILRYSFTRILFSDDLYSNFRFNFDFSEGILMKGSKRDTEYYIDELFRRNFNVPQERLWKVVDKAELIEFLTSDDYQVYDPRAWSRGPQER